MSDLEEVNRKLDGMLKWEQHWDKVGKKKRNCSEKLDIVLGVMAIGAAVLFLVGLYVGYTLGHEAAISDITQKALQHALGIVI